MINKQLSNTHISDIQDESLQQLNSPLNILENPEEYWKSTRKCTRCRKLYTEEENQSENSRCNYHTGSYTDPDNIMNGTLVGWSCCNQIVEKECFFNSLNPNALEFDSKGCKEKRFHDEDVAYTISLRNFPFQAEEKKQEETFVPIEPVDFKKLESISYNELQNNPNFFVHPISITDTLVGIAMKYDIPAGVIQRVNRLPTQQIFERKVLFIPKTKDNQILEFPIDDIRMDRDRIKSKFIITVCFYFIIIIIIILLLFYIILLKQ